MFYLNKNSQISFEANNILYLGCISLNFKIKNNRSTDYAL